MSPDSLEFEHCCECDARTGRAGRADDSLYAGDRGPFCEECYGELPDQLVEECDVKAAHIAELEFHLAAAEADAGRYRLLREQIAPAYLERNGFPNFGVLPESEDIAERIDRMVDAAINIARGVE